MSDEPGASSAGDRDQLLEAIKSEIDDCLAAGERPSPARWARVLPDSEEDIETLIELRTFAWEQDAASEETDPDEGLLSEIEREVQDTLNQGKKPDLVPWQAKHPHLASRIERLAAMQDFVHDALAGDRMAGVPHDKGDEAETALGRYRILRRLGDHPIGTAYLGVSTDPPERVELLVLEPSIGKALGWEILKEADQTRSLQAAGLLPAREVGENRGVRFIASEHREGVSLTQVLFDLAFHGGERTLEQVMPPHGRPVGDVDDEADRVEANRNAAATAKALGSVSAHLVRSVTLVRDVARIVAGAHLEGRLHRNLSPEAVVLGKDGTPSVRWFGLTRYLPPPRPRATPTPLFRAPELLAGADGARVDWRADVWGVGGLLLALLRFEPPLLLEPGDVDRERLLGLGPQRLATELSRLPKIVRVEVARALSWDPVQRHGSCSELADGLDDVLRQIETADRGSSTAKRGDGGWLRRLLSRGRNSEK